MAISSEERTMPLTAYILMLVSVVTGGITAIIAVVLAYASKEEASDDVKSHYEFIIRTFWISLIVDVTAFVLMFTVFLAPLSFLTFIAVFVWVIVRMIMGLVKLTNGDPIADPNTNMFPKN